MRAKRKKYVKDTAIGGTFGGNTRNFDPLLLLLLLLQKWAEEEAGDGHRGHGHGERGIYRGHGRSAREVQRARKRDARDAIKLERIGVKEEQRQKKLEREVEDTLVKAIQKAKVGSPEQRDLIAQ
jgi:hypothetical protein